MPGDLRGVGFFSIRPGHVLVDPEVVDFMATVWQSDGVKQEEGLPRVRFEPAQHVILDRHEGFAEFRPR